MMKPGGTGNPRWVSNERFAPLPPLCSTREANGSLNGRRYFMFLINEFARHFGQPITERRQSKTTEDVGEVMVAQINGGNPEANGGGQIKAESPGPVPPVQKKNITRNSPIHPPE